MKKIFLVYPGGPFYTIILIFGLITVSGMHSSAQLAVSTTQVNVICYGGSTGSATAIATGGTAPYNYSWNTSPVQNGPTATGLSAGTYTVTVTDNVSNTATASVSISQPPAPYMGPCTKTDVTCFGLSNGTVTAGTVSNNVGTIIYSWKNSSGTEVGTTALVSGLPADTYTLTVNDDCFSGSCSVVVEQPTAALEVNKDGQIDVLCYGKATGAINVTVLGGTAPYSYVWTKDGLGATYSTSEDLNNLSAGTYDLKVTDSNGCSTTLSTVTIAQPAGIMSLGTCSKTDVTCYGQSTGSVYAGTVTNNVGAVSYSWTNSLNTVVGTNADVHNLPADIYTLTVTDQCSSLSCSVTVTQPSAALSMGPCSKADVTCYGESTGLVSAGTISNSVGTVGYSWKNSSNVVVGTTAAVNNLPAGTYTLTVMDQCFSVSCNVTIGQPSAGLSMGTCSKVDVTCYGQSTGSVTAGTISNSVGTVGYSWKNSSNVVVGTTATVNNLPAGTYTLAVSDQCSSVSCNVTISQPSAGLSMGACSKTDVVCFGQSTGSVIAGTISNSVGTVNYTWKNSSNVEVGSTATVNNLPAGTYTLTVTDQCSSVSCNVTISQPSAGLSMGACSKTDVVCFGQSTGSVIAGTISNSVGTVNYSWKNSSNVEVGTAATVNNLPAGTYTLTVTDQCSLVSCNVTISQPSAGLSMGACSKTDVICFGQSTGSIIAGTISNSVGTVSYSWKNSSGSTVGSSATINNLPADTYTLTVTDQCSSVSCTVIISQPSAGLSMGTCSKVDVTCYGLSTGSVSAGTISNSVGTVSYSWRNSSNIEVGTTATVNNLPAGTYTLTLTDQCSSVSCNVIISQPSAGLSMGACSKTDVVCFGQSTGSVIAGTISNSVGTVNYSWKNSSNVEVGTAATVNNLPADTYTLTITDQCSLVTCNVTISQPSAGLSMETCTKTDVTCYGQSTGSVSAGTISNNVGEVSYSWKNSSNVVVGTTATVTNLPAGTYTLSATDQCFSVFCSLTINQPSAGLSLGACSKVDVTCYGQSTGSVSAGTVSNEVGSVNYSWKNSSGTVVGTTATVNNLPADSYTLTVTDQCSSVSCNVTISQPSAGLSMGTCTKTDVTCYGQSTGSISAGTIFNNVGTVSYSWRNSSNVEVGTTAIVNNLPADTYTLTVTDQCSSVSCTVTISQPSAGLSMGACSKTDVVCFGQSTGSVIAGTISNSVGTVSYSWKNSSNVEIGTTATVNNLPSGTYSLTASDQCSSVYCSVTIIQPTAPLSVEACSKTDVACFGQSTGSISAGTVSNNVGTISYSWKNSSGTVVGTSVTVSGLPADTYTLTVSDNCSTAGCIVTIDQPSQPLTANSTHTDIKCGGENDGTITINFSGGTCPYQIIFIQGVEVTFETSSVTYGNVPAGTYNWTVQDANGCSVNGSETITEPAKLLISANSNSPVCEGQTLNLSSSTTGGVPPYTFNWSGPGPIPDTSIQSPSITNITTSAAGTYYVTVTDNNNCQASDSTLVTVNLTPSVTDMADTICSGETIIFIPVDGINGKIPPGTYYSWPVPAVSGDLTGGVAGANATSISGTLINNTHVVHTATYSVTPITGICSGPVFTVTVTVIPTVGTPTAIVPSAGIEPTCQLTNGTTTTYSTSVTNSSEIIWSTNNPAAGNIDPVTGVMTWANGFFGSVDIQVQAQGCNGPSAMVKRPVSISPRPIANFNYSGTPFCSNAANPTPTFTGGGVAGTFSSAPSGLDFVSAATGEINLAASVPGTYTVTNTIGAGGGCSAVTATDIITITALPEATFSYAGTPYCQDATNPLPTFSGNSRAGTFSSTAGLVFVSQTTGQVNLAASTAGTYTITNTIPAANGCGEVSATSTITISKPPIANFRYQPNTLCSEADPVQPLFDTGGSSGTFSAPSGLVINSITGEINVKKSIPGDYTVTNTIQAANGCSAVIWTTSVTIYPRPAITVDYCIVAPKIRLIASGGATSTSYNWLSPNSGNTNSVDVDLVGLYGVEVTNGDCHQEVSIQVNEELSTNGDFEDGPAGASTFITDYIYGYTPPNNYQGGHYAIVKDAADFNPPYFHGAHDHTSGDGYFMAIDGTSSSYVVWQQDIIVEPNTDYYFSAWGLNLNNVSDRYPILQFSINDSLVGSQVILNKGTTEPDNPWLPEFRFWGSWNSGDATLAHVKIRNLLDGLMQNDFGIDDISFGTLVPPPFALISHDSTNHQSVCVNTPISDIIYRTSKATSVTVNDLPNGVNYSFVSNKLTIYGSPTQSDNSPYTYTVTVTGSCSNPITVTGTITVIPEVSGGTISGTTPLCINETATYNSDGNSGGTWSSTNTGVATVDPSSGLVTAHSPGTTNITYTVSNGCGSPKSSYKTLIVSPDVTAGVINGTTPLCINNKAQYSTVGGATGGTWSSFNEAVATVDATGQVTALSSGTTSITYTVSTGCGSPKLASKLLTVSPNKNAGNINGQNLICLSDNPTLTTDGDPGGTWTSSNTSVATIASASGKVTGIGEGTSTISYSINSGCGSPVSSSFLLTVKNDLIWDAGGGSDDWNTASNWDPDFVPIPCSNVIIPETNLFPVVSASNAVCRNMTILPKGRLSIDNTGILTTSGITTINSDADGYGSMIINGQFTGQVTYNLWVTNAGCPGYSDRAYIISSPVSGQDAQVLRTSGSISGIRDYNEPINDWGGEISGNLTPGKGYAIYKEGPPGRVPFVGTPNMGDIPVTVSSSYARYGWNSVGNPYTSSLQIKESTGFIYQNIVNEPVLEPYYGAIYMYNEAICNFDVINLSGYYNDEWTLDYYGFVHHSNDDVVQVGQGFLVNIRWPYPNKPIEFRKVMQTHSPLVSLKKAAISWPGITLIAHNGTETEKTIITFFEGGTTGLDPGYDAANLPAYPFQLFTRFVSGNQEVNLAIQTLPDQQYNQLVVPVGINYPSGGNVTFRAGGVILPDGLYPILEDRLLKTTTPLKSIEDSYSVTVPANTSGTGRFFLHFSNTTRAEMMENTLTKYSAWVSDHKIVISGLPDRGTKALLYDLNGRKLGEYRLNDENRNEIPAQGLVTGVYLLHIQSATGRQVIKVPVLQK